METNKSKDFSIITPSYNMLSHLKRCCASVADQEGVTFEHIVIDAASKDGTPQWLENQNSIKSISEPDDGMYQAVNKGFKLAKGNILAYLNCDEQYLPGTLQAAKEFFDKHEDIDILFGDMLVVDNEGELIAYRKTFQPRWQYICASYLYVFTCTMFIRRNVIDEGNYFDENLKGIGDAEFVIRLLKKGYIANHIKKYLSVFTITGHNLCLNNSAFKKEEATFRKMAPIWIKLSKVPLNILRLLEKAFCGSYSQKVPFEYCIYGTQNLIKRRSYIINSATFRLPKY